VHAPARVCLRNADRDTRGLSFLIGTLFLRCVPNARRSGRFHEYQSAIKKIFGTATARRMRLLTVAVWLHGPSEKNRLLSTAKHQIITSA